MNLKGQYYVTYRIGRDEDTNEIVAVHVVMTNQVTQKMVVGVYGLEPVPGDYELASMKIEKTGTSAETPPEILNMEFKREGRRTKWIYRNAKLHEAKEPENGTVVREADPE